MTELEKLAGMFASRPDLAQHLLEAENLPAGWREAVEAARRPDAGALSDRAEVQHNRKEYHTALRSVDAGTAAVNATLFPNAVHLPDEANIASVYVANRSTGRINVTIGPGATGVTLGVVAPNTFMVSPVPDMVSCLSFVMLATGTGLVVVLISTLPWTPSAGALT